MTLKDSFALINIAVFEKAIENGKIHRDIKLLTTKARRYHTTKKLQISLFDTCQFF